MQFQISKTLHTLLSLSFLGLGRLLIGGPATALCIRFSVLNHVTSSMSRTEWSRLYFSRDYDEWEWASLMTISALYSAIHFKFGVSEMVWSSRIAK